MTSTSDKLIKLKKDCAELCSATCSVGWDRSADELVANPKDLGAKPVTKHEWSRAFLIASKLTTIFPWLDAPIPGADPEGFVWLTWSQGNVRGLALEVHKNFYKWTMRDENGKKTVQSDSLDDVAEAMRSTFRRVTL